MTNWHLIKVTSYGFATDTTFGAGPGKLALENPNADDWRDALDKLDERARRRAWASYGWRCSWSRASGVPRRVLRAASSQDTVCRVRGVRRASWRWRLRSPR